MMQHGLPPLVVAPPLTNHHIHYLPPFLPSSLFQALHLSFLPFGTKAAESFIQRRLAIRPLRSGAFPDTHTDAHPPPLL